MLYISFVVGSAKLNVAASPATLLILIALNPSEVFNIIIVVFNILFKVSEYNNSRP